MPRKKESDTIVILVAALLIITVAAIAQINRPNFPEFPEVPQLPVQQGYHAHADFLVMINGKAVDFEKMEYDVADPAIHLHTGNFAGDSVLHVESEAADLDDFFSSLGMELNSTCFAVDEEYCSNSTHTIKFYVNSERNDEYEKYEPVNLDRILITYGNETDVGEQIASVSSYACVFSGICPAPEEAVGKIIYN